MKYILKDGYIDEVSFGGTIECKNQTCTEYTGSIPDGYTSLEEWFIGEEGKLNAWKLVDGNLVFDSNKYETLQVKCEKEAEDNRYVRYKEISNINNIIKTDTSNNYKRSTTDLLNLLEVIDSNKFSSEYIKLIANKTITNSITIKFNNGNLLTNDATSKTESGISFEVNVDRSIQISGTAIADIEFNIGGTSTNTKPILVLKKNTNYYLSSNDYTIKMYAYDGTDRTEVYSGIGGIINLSSDSKVTNIVLAIASGATINDTIYPMLNLGTTAEDYVTYQGNESTIFLDGNSLYIGDYINIENGSVILQNSPFIGDDLIIGDSFIIGGSTIMLDDIGMPYTYLNKTYMYAYEDVKLMVTYPNTERDLDLCGYETPNSGFSIDEEGNAYLNNGTFRGNIYFPNSDSKIVGGEGLLSTMIVNASIWSKSFLGGQGFMPLGFDAISESGVAQSQMIEFVIPENFIPKKAFIYLRHIPLKHSGNFSGTTTKETYTGYSRNIKAYICSDGSFGRNISYINEEPEITGNYSEITNCFGVNGFTGNSSILTEITSIDIIDYIKNAGTYSIKLKSGATAPSGFQNIYEYTGSVLAQLYIIGYTNLE
jgi:hypothetical protein